MPTHFAEKTKYQGDKYYMPRRPKMCRRIVILAETTNLMLLRRPKCRRRVQNISPTRPRISPTRPKYIADASKDFAEASKIFRRASKIFRRRVQWFRRRVQRFHCRRGNAADATSYRTTDTTLISCIHVVTAIIVIANNLHYFCI